MNRGFPNLARRAILAVTLLASVSLLATVAIPALGHSGATAAQVRADIPSITIRMSAVHVPAQLPAGLFALTVANDARMPASVDVGRAKPGATAAAIAAANATAATPTGFRRLLRLVTFLGGSDDVPPGATQTAIVDLSIPGHYALHVSLSHRGGHDYQFTVRPGGAAPAAPPPNVIAVRVKDMKVAGLPPHLAAGSVTFQVTSAGPSVHEMILARLEPGKSARDVATVVRERHQGHGGPPPWVHVVGGLGLLSAHQSAYLRIHLTAGAYVALCMMPDTRPGKQGEPHAAEGMLTAFVVS